MSCCGSTKKDPLYPLPEIVYEEIPTFNKVIELFDYLNGRNGGTIDQGRIMVDSFNRLYRKSMSFNEIAIRIAFKNLQHLYYSYKRDPESITIKKNPTTTTIIFYENDKQFIYVKTGLGVGVYYLQGKGEKANFKYYKTLTEEQISKLLHEVENTMIIS